MMFYSLPCRDDSYSIILSQVSCISCIWKEVNMTLRFKHSSLNFFDFKECYHGFYLATLRPSRRKVSNAMSLLITKFVSWKFLFSPSWVRQDLFQGLSPRELSSEL